MTTCNGAKKKFLALLQKRI